MTTVLVTGATGNIGTHVMRELRGRGVRLRAFVRDADKATRLLGDDVDRAVGDFDDHESVRRAVSDVDVVFLTSGDGPRKVEHETGVIDAAAAAGVKRVVKLSTLGAEAGSPLPGLDWHGRVEGHLRRSGVPAVILRANFYMSNLLASAQAITAGEPLAAPAGRGTVSMIDPRDVAVAAAAALTTPGLEGQTMVLTGPEVISYQDVADVLSNVTGHEVRYVDVPPDAARQSFVEAGMPGWLVAHLAGAFGLISQGALAELSDDVRTLTGRPPRSFAEFARDYAHLFKPSTG
jgi:uncharacterized protein YbjT (DUF2867 family)